MSPTVPVYAEERVTSTATPTPYRQGFGPVTFGAGLGEGLQAGGKELEAFARKEQQKHDLARVQEGQALLGEWRARNLFDEQQGYLRKKGKDALGQQDKYLADWDSTVAAITSNLANDDQRRAFETEATAQKEQVQRQMSGHALQQADALADGTYKAVLDTATSEAANAYTDPVAVAEARHTGIAAVLARRKAEGWNPEQTDAQLRSFTTGLHLSVVDRMVAAGDGEGAQRYLQTHGHEIDGTARARVDRQVEVAKLGTEAERKAAAIVATARTEVTGWVDSDKALALVDDVPEGPLRDEVRQRVEHRVVVADHEKARDVDEHFKAAYTAYLKGGLGAVPAQLKTWLVERAPEKWDQLRDDAERRYRMSKADKSEARRLQAEVNRVALLDFMSRPTEERAALDVEGVYGATGVDPSGLGALKVRQRQATDALQKGAGVKEAEFIRDANAEAAQLLKGNKAKAKEFEAEMRLEFDDFQAQNKRPPNREEAQQIRAAALTEVVKERAWLWDTTERAYQRRARERQQAPGAAPAPAAATPAAPPAPGRMVPVISPDGKVGMAAEAGLDAWLAAHPGWRRK